MIKQAPNLPIPSGNWSFSPIDLSGPILSFSIATFGSIAGIIILAKYLSKTNFWRNIALVSAQDSTKGYSTEITELKALKIGTEGKSLTTLRPTGKAVFGSKQYEVMTENIFIEKDTPIKILEVSNNNIIVDKITKEE